MADDYTWIFTIVLPVIFGAIGAAGVIFGIMSRKKGPKIVASCYNSGWYRRTQTSIVTNVVIFLKFESKTDSATTVKDCILEVEYEGRKYGPYASESLNIDMTPRRATDKRVEFTIPVADVDIKHDIEHATVRTNYIPKTTVTHVVNIPNQVV